MARLRPVQCLTLPAIHVAVVALLHLATYLQPEMTGNGFLHSNFPRPAVGMGIPMGMVWGGYGDRNSVPTAALNFSRSHVVNSHSFPFPSPKLKWYSHFHGILIGLFPFPNTNSRTVKCKCKQSTVNNRETVPQ